MVREKHISSWSHVHRTSIGILERNQRLQSPFAKLWMTEDDLVRPGRDRYVPQRCFAEARAVDQHFGPRDRVDADRCFGQIDLQRCCLTGTYLDLARRSIP